MNNSLYKSIIDNSSIGYAYHELVFNGKGKADDCVFLEVNHAFEKLIGIKAKDIIGRRITSILPDIPTEDFDWVAFYSDIIEKNLQKDFKQFDKPFDKECWVNVFSPEENRFVTLFSAPEENVANFKKLFENMPIGGVLYRVINDGKLGSDYIGLDFNKQSCTLEGKSREQMIGKTNSELRPCIDEYGLIDLYRKVWKSGISEKFPIKMYVDDKFSNYYDIDVFRLSEDTIVVMYNDVTEIMNNQKELQDKSIKLSTYIDKAPYGIFIADKEGNFLEVNSKACSMSGYEPDELTRKNLLDFVAQEHKQMAFRSFVSLRENGFIDTNSKYITKTGLEKWWNVRATKLNENRFLGFTVDITDKILLEEENTDMQMMLHNQQRIEAIGTFASGIAHEINNPINGIMNYSQLISDSSQKDTEIYQYANEIILETKRIADIIQSLLQFSRQEKRTMSSARIDNIVSSTSMLINAILKHDSINFTLAIDNNLPEIKCRFQQIQQVLLNLITNASYSLNEKFPNDNKRKKIEFSAKLIKVEGIPHIQLLVKDNGNGIPDDIKEKVFDPFFTTKPKEKGSGLGLAICYGIIKEHSGNIYFKSKKGKYTKFFVELPVSNS